MTQVVQLYTNNPQEFKKNLKTQIEKSPEKSKYYRQLFDLLYHLIQKNRHQDCFSILNEIITPDALYSLLSQVQFPNFYNEITDFPPFDLFYIVALISYQTQGKLPSTYLFLLFNFYLQFYESLQKCVNSQDIILNDEIIIENKKTLNDALSIINSRLSTIAGAICTIYHARIDKTDFSNFVDIIMTTKSYLFHDSAFACLVGRMCLSLNKYNQAQEIFSYISDLNMLSSNQPYVDFFKMNFPAAANGFEMLNGPFDKINQVVALIYLGNIKQAATLFNEKIRENPILKLFNSVKDIAKVLNELCDGTEIIKEKQFSNYPTPEGQCN